MSDDYRDDPTCLVAEQYRDRPTEPICGQMVRAGGGFYSLPRDVLLCANCTHWRPDAIAHPELGERCGSVRICARGNKCHSGMWCSSWERQSDQQIIEAAQEVGRLF